MGWGLSFMFDVNEKLHEKKRAARPRDAATLILVRTGNGPPEILMGRRPDTMKFMPGKFVFPGGRVDRADHFIMPVSGLRPEVHARVASDIGNARATAIALAAIRETFEETGLLVGARSDRLFLTRNPVWRAYAKAGATPALDGLTLIARAVTPPYRDRRFDTRFFMGNASLIVGRETASHSGELLEPQWVTFAMARTLDLPTITRVVLDEAERRVDDLTRDVPCPYFRFVRGRAQISSI